MKNSVNIAARWVRAIIIMCAFFLGGGATMVNAEANRAAEESAQDKQFTPPKMFMKESLTDLLRFNFQVLQLVQSEIVWPHWAKLQEFSPEKAEALNRQHLARLTEFMAIAHKELDAKMDASIEDAKTTVYLKPEDRESVVAALEVMKVKKMPALHAMLKVIEEGGVLASEAFGMAVDRGGVYDEKNKASPVRFQSEADQRAFDQKMDAMNAVAKALKKRFSDDLEALFQDLI